MCLSYFFFLSLLLLFFLVFSAVPVVFSVPVPAPDVVVEPTWPLKDSLFFVYATFTPSFLRFWRHCSNLSRNPSREEKTFRITIVWGATVWYGTPYWLGAQRLPNLLGNLPPLQSIPWTTTWLLQRMISISIQPLELAMWAWMFPIWTGPLTSMERFLGSTKWIDLPVIGHFFL